MNPFNVAWLLLKQEKRQGFYREATIPSNPREPVSKVSLDRQRHPFANRFATLALAQSLADMGKPIEPETPVAGGGVEQRQMDEVFGQRGHRDDYGTAEGDVMNQYDDPPPNTLQLWNKRRKQLENLASSPLMQMLGLNDFKGPNVGMKDGQMTVFDPAFRTFRGHKVGQYGKPLDFNNYSIHPNIEHSIKRVPSDELAELTQRVKDYRPKLDVWENDGDLRSWQEGMGDYHALRDTLTYLNSLRQDPQQTKLFQYEGFGKDPQQYTDMMQELR